MVVDDLVDTSWPKDDTAMHPELQILPSWVKVATTGVDFAFSLRTVLSDDEPRYWVLNVQISIVPEKRTDGLCRIEWVARDGKSFPSSPASSLQLRASLPSSILKHVPRQSAGFF